MIKLPHNEEYSVELVALHITNVCSHRCPYCYFADPDIKPKHPPFDQLIRVIDALGNSKVHELSLLGGDPACYPRVVELAKHAVRTYGMYVSILSNTLIFRHSSPKEVAQYIKAFETTIHHVEPELHDKFCRKKGAYQKVVRQLKTYSELGGRTGIAINIIPEIHDKIFLLIDRIVNKEHVPLDYIVVQRIIPFGRATGSSSFTLSRAQAERSLIEIREVDVRLGIEIAVEDPFPLCVLPESLKKYMVPCQWGITKAAVNSKGDLSRCGADPRYLLGNIFDTPLLEIWNTSEILKSFRGKNYLPGRCRICPDIQDCGGGCPLSCEIEKDHGIDYLFLEYEKLNEEIHGEITFSQARSDELSSILQIEWSDFPGYGHIFSVESIKKWYNHNPEMFWVVRDSRNWVLGYAVLVPIREKLYRQILNGQLSSLVQFPMREVLTNQKSLYYHIEVLASVPSRTASRAGRYLIKSIPVSDMGLRLCKYFGFRHVSDEKSDGHIYPIYSLEVNSEIALKELNRF
ncbi:MAG: radical SAM/SPASM domain-containing protein [Candidatus Hodarchaeota archaeon]